jgi:hypothetical protein
MAAGDRNGSSLSWHLATRSGAELMSAAANDRGKSSKLQGSCGLRCSNFRRRAISCDSRILQLAHVRPRLVEDRLANHCWSSGAEAATSSICALACADSLHQSAACSRPGTFGLGRLQKASSPRRPSASRLSCSRCFRETGRSIRSLTACRAGVGSASAARQISAISSMVRARLVRLFCGNCGRDSTWSKEAIISTPLKLLHDRYAKTLEYEEPNRAINLDDYADCTYTVWASTPAIVWTAARPQEFGIHVHVHRGRERIIDDTFREVILNGMALLRAELVAAMIGRSII